MIHFQKGSRRIMSICILLNKTFSTIMEFSKEATGTIKGIRKRQKLKEQVLEQVKATVPNKRWSRAVKLERVLDEIIYKATDRGFSFNGRKKLMELCECKETTVKEATRILKESGLFDVVYRENPNSNGFKTPVFILKSHSNYEYIMELVEIQDYKRLVKRQVENAETSTETRDSSDNLVATNLSQKKDINTKKTNNNNEVNYINQLNEFNMFVSTKDRATAKALMDKNPRLHDVIKSEARKIAEELPPVFSDLDWSVFTDLMLTQLTRKQKKPKKPVGYVVKAFYKNKVLLAEKLGLSLDNEVVLEDYLPEKYKISKLIKPYLEKMKVYEQQGNVEMIALIELQINRYMEKIKNSKCVVTNI